jgi:serine/threonine protein kinase
MSDSKQVATSEQFVEVLQASRVLPTDQVSKVRERSARVTDPIALARELIAAHLLTRWQARQLLVGRHRLTLGKYRLCEEIGRSPSGGVFLAEHLQMHRKVAIKVMSRRWTRDPTYVARFLDETRKAATLDHQNVLHIYDIDNENDRYFLVLEHISGWDLQQLVTEKGVRTFVAAADYLRQTAEGLLHIHRKQMVHGELRPANLMVDTHGKVKILGLGTGHLPLSTGGIQRDAAREQSEEPLDLLAYRAPEQTVADNTANERSDLFSLGCIGYFLITGNLPLAQPGGQPLCHADVAATVPAISKHRPEIPAELATIIDQLMARDAAARYRSAEPVIQALRQWIADQEDSPTGQVVGAVEPTESNSPAATDALESGPAPSEDRPPFDWAPANEIEPSQDREPVAPPPRARARENRSIAPRHVLGAVALLLAIVATTIMGVWVWNREPAVSDASSEQVVTVAPPPRDTLAPATSDQPVQAEPPTTVSPDDTVAPDDTVPDPGESVTAEQGALAAADMGSAQTDTADRSTATSEPATTSTETPETSDTTSGDTSDDAAEDTPAPVPAPAPEPPPPVLQHLPAEFDLQLPSTDDLEEPQQLGRLQMREGIALEVKLLGGSTALAADGEFLLRSVPVSSSPTWEVQLREQIEGTAATTAVAQLQVVDQQLVLRWIVNPTNRPSAGSIVNCVLRVKAGQEEQDLRLRVPQIVSPLEVQLKRPSFDGKWDIEHPPAPAATRWCVTSLAEPFPPDFELVPPTPMVPDGQQVVLKCGADPEQQVLLFEIEASLKRLLRINGRTMFQLPTMEEPSVLTRRNFLARERWVSTNQINKHNQAQIIQEQLQRIAAQDPRRATVQQQFDAAQQQLAEATRISDAWETLRGLTESLDDGATIHFRLDYLADDCRVTLLASDAASAAASVEQELIDE